MPRITKKTRKKRAKRVDINGKWYRVKSNGKPGVHLTRNDGWWTEAEFLSRVRSAIRQISKYWKPKQRYKDERCRLYKGAKKNIKYEGQCEKCDKWYAKSALQVDHITPCGSLKTLNDVKGFIERTCIEGQDGWQLLCKTCHGIKTYVERYGVSEEQAIIRKKELARQKKKKGK